MAKKPKPEGQPTKLKGWAEIAQFLSMPQSTIHRWAKDGMPVRREGRNVVAVPEELNAWLQRTSGEHAGVQVVSENADLVKALRLSVASQKDDPAPIARESSSKRPKRHKS